jgi:release factor glutamine methyltransferase
MVQINYKDYLLDVPKDIYYPSDDTYLLLDVLKKEIIYGNKSFLEVGTGSGLITLTMYDFFDKLTVVDIDEKVIEHITLISKKLALTKIIVIKSDLFSKIDFKKFDVIVFNPPYVPSEKIEVYSTDGGKDGCEIIFKFIKSLKNHLNKKGVCYFLVSSHNNLSKVYNEILKNKLSYKILIEKNIFFEKLIILKISDDLCL